MKNGDLFDVIKESKGLKNLEVTRYLFKQICMGVKNIHDAGFCHLDLKIDNILIGNDFKLKVCDFGMAMPKESKLNKIYGTLTYMAPEIFNI